MLDNGNNLGNSQDGDPMTWQMSAMSANGKCAEQAVQEKKNLFNLKMCLNIPYVKCIHRCP